MYIGIMSKSEQIGVVTLAPTDNRMRAKRYNYGYRMVIPDFEVFSMLRQVAQDQLGPWAYFGSRYVHHSNERFGSEYDYNSDFTKIRHKLYFLNREDAENVLTLFILQHGTTE
jgi:hypothetical protein